MNLKSIFAIGLLAISSQPSLASSIKQYEKYDRVTQSFYIGGIADGLGMLQAYYQKVGVPNIFCLPSDVRFGPDLAKVALSNFSGSKDLPVAFGVIEGITKMFPCE
mgnify:CR=1 FL=1